MDFNERYGVLPDNAQAHELAIARFGLMRDFQEKGVWSHLLNHFAVVRDDKTVLYSLTMTEEGTFVLGINFTAFMLLANNREAQKCVLKLPCFNILFGHVSSKANRLRKQYGDRIFEIASEIVINQAYQVDLRNGWKPLEDEGFLMASPELYDLPKGLSTEGYCAALHSRYSSQSNPLPTNIKQAKDIEQLLPKSLTSKDKPKGLSKHPNWIKNGQIDQEALKEAIKNGEVVVGGLGELDNDAEEELADMASKDIIDSTASHTGMKSQGWFKGEMVDFIKSLEREPVIEWIQYLQQRERHHTDLLLRSTKRRPSRRHDSFFGRHHMSNCHVLVVIDTSGSMQPNELCVIQNELLAMLRRNAYIQVMMVDADVQREPIVFDRWTELEKFFGRGGTDFRPAFEYIDKKMMTKPNFVVYFTDGYGTAPDKPPEFMDPLDVLWVLTSKGLSPTEFKNTVCDFGTAVVFNTDNDVK